MTTISRYAIAVADGIEEVRRIVSALALNKIAASRVAVLGLQNRGYLNGNNTAAQDPVEQYLSLPENRRGGELAEIMLGGIEESLLPAWARQNAVAFRHSLERWLAPAHACRLSEAIQNGGVLIWIRINSAEEEQVATRCLLHNSQAPVAIHDFFLP